MNVSRFRRVLQAVLLSAGPCATIACSSSETEMPERAQCVDLNATTRYSALTLAPGVDGIAFAARIGPRNARATAPIPAVRLPALGAPCAGATDREACAARIEALFADPSSEGWNVVDGSCQQFRGCVPANTHDLAIITNGDDVRLTKLDGLVRAIAPVTSRDEAAAILQLKGFTLDCNMNNVRPEGDGWVFKKTSSSCDGAKSEHFYKVLAATGEVVDAGRNTISEGDNGCIEGRRPANLAPTGVSWLSSLAACFGEIAHMEAAAVLAFDDLSHQLRSLGAPVDLLARAARARRDEVAHAAVTARLARRFGATPATPRVETTKAMAEPSLLQLARENAVEGCVREAYGALVAAHQAAHSSDAKVRAAFKRIALDEAEHAELSFAIDAWIAPQLSEEERHIIEEEKAQAWRDLAASCDVEPAAEVVRVAGVPSASEARALLASLTWAVADVAA